MHKRNSNCLMQFQRNKSQIKTIDQIEYIPSVGAGVGSSVGAGVGSSVGAGVGSSVGAGVGSIL